MKRMMSLVLVLSFILSLCTFASAEAERRNFEQVNCEKMSEEVLSFVETAEDEDILDVYVIVRDIDEDEVMEAFAVRYPDEYAEYMKACEADIPPEIIAGDREKLEEELLRDNLNKNIDGDLLQAGIEKKREVFREFYNERNEGILNKYIEDDQVIYCGHYAPMVIVHARKQQILEIVKDDLVVGIDQFVDCEMVSCLSTAYQTTKIAYLRDTCGNTGSTVKIGLLEGEYGVPILANPELSSASIAIYPASTNVENEHATRTATILVGSYSGVAPAANLYCRAIGLISEYYEAVEYLLDQGVNIINFSGGRTGIGIYSNEDRWTDHIARQHDVHFVVSAGNEDEMGLHIVTPAMAYNAITVGSYNTHYTATDSDDELSTFSNWIKSETDKAEKPNLIAPGESLYFPYVATDSGTSYAAPMVAGTIADLCSYNYALKVKQTAIGAIMAASSTLKIDGSLGTGYYGDSFAGGSGNYRVENNPQIHQKEGAGKLNAKASRYIVTTAQWWGTTVSASSFPYTQTVYIDSSSNSLTRVALFWLKRNSLSDHYLPIYYDDYDLSNLNLQIVGPNGNVVASSTTSYSNYEIVQFVPAVTGNYTIKVIRVSGTSPLENIGLAVY
ncbi:MAG: S8/S53 family peptidase [Lachnospiraceae bacterium]|nr:S8/S53 family peptidase [Lachnospiraceae bacterium]